MDTPENKNPWETLSRKSHYENAWMEVSEFQVINPGGHKGIYGKVHFKNKAVGIIPLDEEGNTWLVGQFRYPLGQFSWEIPEGGSPEGTDPLETAHRELKEETGLSAGKMKLIMKIHTSNSVTDEEGYIFLAENLTQGKNALEVSEADLIVKKIPFQEALSMVMDGRITDSLSVAALLKVARMKNW